MSTSNKPHRATTCGYCHSRVPAGHECEQKREAMKERHCLLESCRALFKPTVHGQACCCHNHKRMSRNQREYAAKLRREQRGEKRKWPAKGFKSEINTIAPLERAWARAEKQAQQYAPVMGEALVEITLKLMRAKA